MPSRSLNYIWAGLDLALLAAGIISIVFSVMWQNPDILMRFILFDINLTMGTVLGAMFLTTFVVSLFAITQRRPLTLGLKIFNWMLVADSIAVLVMGSIVWYYSLREPANYLKVWVAQPTSTQAALQDMFKCCGYNNGTKIALEGTFCGTDITTASTHIGCMTAVTHAADYTINNIFTSIYGFMAITLSLILASICHINLRVEEDRFRRIDEKRGRKGGFV